jgi:predicted HAD superfamily Cof-like phosphohydrolase
VSLKIKPQGTKNSMTNVFKDQTSFMMACDQTVCEWNKNQLDMYHTLIKEEALELQEAFDTNDRVEILDALIDIIVVTVGAINSMGSDGEGAWNEVMRTNFAKIDPTTGKVNKRSDGKVLKPDNWKSPNLKPYVI